MEGDTWPNFETDQLDRRTVIIIIIIIIIISNESSLSLCLVTASA